MMTDRRLLVLATVVALLTGVILTPALGGVRRERSESRPTIVEIGEPYSISMATVQREAERISDLREFLIRNGYPDYAEVQEISPEWPWESYEVRLYYMHWNLEADFGQVLFSDAITDLGVLKYQGTISPEKRHEIDVILEARATQPAPEPAPVTQMPQVTAAPPMVQAVPPAAADEPPAPEPLSDAFYEALAARLEAAADRASRAADAAVEQSEAALRAADRTVSIVEKLEASAGSSRGSQR